MYFSNIEERMVFKYLSSKRGEDMDYAKLSEQRLDDIMLQIRAMNQPSEGINYDAIDKLMADMTVGTQIGENKSPMYNKKGIKRKIARVVELVYLRISQLITRDMRSFNTTVIALFAAFRRELSNAASFEEKLMELTQGFASRIAEMEKAYDILADRFAETEKAYDILADRFAETEKAYDILADRFAEAEKAYGNMADITESLKMETHHQMQSAETHMSERINERTTALVDKLNDNSLRMRDLNDQVVSIKAIMKWANNAQFTREVAEKQGCAETDSPIFYHDFEEKFRGTQEDIRNRLEIYIPKIEEHFSSLADMHIVDIGCGRGEWLDVLRTHGAKHVIGIDINELYVCICKEKGHTTIAEDGIAYLRSCQSDSLDMITGFQIIEHLDMDQLCMLLNECMRVLKPNGVILFETPNPNNLITSATYFYVDPTHNRPIHKDLARFYVEHSGYSQVEIIEANPVKYSKNLLTPICFDGNQNIWDENVNILNALFFGAQDYAVWGVKA